MTNVLTRRLAVAALAVAGALGVAAPASAAAPLAVTSYVSNETNISIGVSKTDDGRNYQALLAAHRRTDDAPLYWDKAATYWVGAGSCLDIWYFQAGSWRFWALAVGPVEVPVVDVPGESVDRWAVRNHRRC